MSGLGHIGLGALFVLASMHGRRSMHRRSPPGHDRTLPKTPSLYPFSKAWP
jgi:hypothetical protein